MTRPIALFGASGQAGSALRRLAPPDWEILTPSRQEMSAAWLDRNKPGVIVNAAAYNAVELAENEAAQAREANAATPARLAIWTEANGAYLVHFSTDYVFSGEQTAPILENEPISPLNAYGASKAEGERLIRESGAQACIIRTSAVFGTRENVRQPHNFIEKILAQAAPGKPFPVRDDLTFCPTWADDLARTTVQKILGREVGLFHCTSVGQTTWQAWAREIVTRAGMNPRLIGARQGDPPGMARRPRYTVLGDSHRHSATPWIEALDIYFRNRSA